MKGFSHIDNLNIKEFLYYPSLREESYALEGVEVDKEIVDLGFSSGNKICIFAHFDAASKLHKYVIEYLKKIKKFGYDIVFVTTSEEIPELEQLKDYVNLVVHRKNIGHDFVSWQSFILTYKKLLMGKEVLLTNDSIFVDPEKVDAVFHDMDNRDFDIYGATKSYQYAEHLQSYFVNFDHSVTQSEYFWEFWEQYPCSLVKDSVVKHGEIGMSQFFLEKGFKLYAFSDSIGLTTSSDINPVYDKGVELLEEYNYPFLKKQLVVHFYPKKTSRLRKAILSKRFSEKFLTLILDFLGNQNKATL